MFKKINIFSDEDNLESLDNCSVVETIMTADKSVCASNTPVNSPKPSTSKEFATEKCSATITSEALKSVEHKKQTAEGTSSVFFVMTLPLSIPEFCS